MPFCSECGASLNGAFCANCGHPGDLERKSGDKSQPIGEARSAQVKAGVTDILERPDSVRLAVTLLYISLAVRVLTVPIAFLEGSRQGQGPIPGSLKAALVALGLLAFIFALYVINRINSGRNWARILCLVLTILSITFSLVGFQQQMELAPLTTCSGLAVLGLNIVALVFLFQQRSSDWYKHAGTRIRPGFN